MPWNRIAEGVTFYTNSATHFHTYTDWGLIMESDNVTFPPVSGVVDGWENMYGKSYTDFRKKYGRRKLIFDLGKSKVDSRWPALVSTITGAIHGKKCRVIRDCENAVYYIGRCNVTSYVTHLGIGKIRIEVDAEPLKIATSSTSVTLDASVLQTTSAEIFTGQTHFEAPVAVLSILFDTAPGNITITVSNAYAPASEIKISDVGVGRLNISSERRTIILSHGSSDTNLFPSCTKLTRMPVVMPGTNRVRVSPSNRDISNAYVTYSPRFI